MLQLTNYEAIYTEITQHLEFQLKTFSILPRSYNYLHLLCTATSGTYEATQSEKNKKTVLEFLDHFFGEHYADIDFVGHAQLYGLKCAATFELPA